MVLKVAASVWFFTASSSCYQSHQSPSQILKKILQLFKSVLIYTATSFIGTV